MGIPKGYEEADEFSATSPIISIPAGAGFLGAAPTILATRQSNAGVKVFFSEMSCRVVDLGSNQIFFTFRRSGQFPLGNLQNIPGVVFDFTAKIPINYVFESGLFEIVASNISGTGLPGAGAAVAINCEAYWAAIILREIHKKFR